MKGYLRAFQLIVRLYRDISLRRDEMKDDSLSNKRNGNVRRTEYITYMYILIIQLV